MFRRSFSDVVEFLFSRFDFFLRFQFQSRFQTSKPPLSLSTHGKMLLENGYGWPIGGLDVCNGEQ